MKVNKLQPTILNERRGLFRIKIKSVEIHTQTEFFLFKTYYLVFTVSVTPFGWEV